MKTKQVLFRVFQFIFMSALVLLPSQRVRADTGPKPTMQFNFVYETDTPLTIVSGVLLECADPQCLDAEPLQEMGPQGFSCFAGGCSSLAYSYADYHRLSIEFSDGITRESNIFTKKYFSADYQVTVRQADLLVKEQAGGGKPFLFFLLDNALLCILLPIMLIPFILFVILVIKAVEFGRARWLYIFSWFFSLLMLALSLLNSDLIKGLVVTLLVELTIALLYAILRKQPISLVLTTVLMMNLFTRITLGYLYGNSPAAWEYHGISIYLAELVIWLVEGGVMTLAFRRKVSFIEAFVLSAVLNLASFGIGFLLPF